SVRKGGPAAAGDGVSASTNTRKRPPTNGPTLKGQSLIGGAPGRAVLPVRQSVRCPRRWFVRMADVARVRDLQAIGPRRINEGEGVAAHIHVGDRLLDRRHVAG